MTSLVLTVIAIALIVAAIALLYMKWLGRGLPAALTRIAVPGAWVAMIASAALWMTAYKPDFGLPFGFLIAMTLPLALIAWRTDWTPKAEKERRARSIPDVPHHLGKRKILRIVARLISCLVIAPLSGMALAMLAWEFMPGHEANKYAMAVFAFSVASASTLVVAVSAQRPWRALGFISATTAAVSAVVSLPILTGALWI